MENRTIAVVTGANGFVGSHLVDYLIEKNFKVRCIVRKSSDLKWLTNKEVEIFDCGLLDKVGLRKAFADAEYIFHVAGVVKSKHPIGYFDGNVKTTETLLEVAKEFKTKIKRFLIVGSQTASGPSRDANSPVDENSECKPITTYGRSKREQEIVAQKYFNELPITICRAPAVYGERDTEIFIFFQTFAKGLFTTIGLNKKVISLIHVRDLVEGFYLAAMSEKGKSETFFISSEKFYSWEEIGEVTSRVMGKKTFHLAVPHFLVFSIASISQLVALFSSKAATLNIEKAKDITQVAWICSPKKAVDLIGYKQKISLEEGMKRTVEWYRQMKWL